MTKHPTRRRAAAALAGALAALPALAQHPATILADAGPGLRDVRLEDGTTPAPAGSIVALGGFPAGFDPLVALVASGVSATWAEWIPFGATTVQEIFGQPGRFSESIDGTVAAALADQQVYLWVAVTVGGAAVLPDFSNVVQHGLFAGAPADGWSYPDAAAFPPLREISSSEVNAALVGTTTDASLVLALVPEPRAAAVALAGVAMALAGAGRRRRISP